MDVFEMSTAAAPPNTYSIRILGFDTVLIFSKNILWQQFKRDKCIKSKRVL